jgi:hypothetical protein
MTLERTAGGEWIELVLRSPNAFPFPDLLARLHPK